MCTAHVCISVSCRQTGHNYTHVCVWVFVCVCVWEWVRALVLGVVWICRRPAYRSPWPHEGRYGGWGLGPADMTAQFKEMEQEMQAESEQSCLYIHLGWAWETLQPPCTRLWLQAGRQVDLQVLHSALAPCYPRICDLKKVTISHAFQWELSVDGSQSVVWSFIVKCMKISQASLSKMLKKW